MEENQIIERFISEITNKYKKRLFLEKLLSIVFNRISSGRENPFNISEISNSLNVSERTLYRRLNEIEISYFEIKDEVRKKYCVYLLSLDKYTVNEISCFLFFKDSSHFIQSFKRWYGCTPKKWKINNYY